NRSTLVGLFLATLELVRHHGVHLEQGDLFQEIWILPGGATTEPLDLSGTDNYEPGGSKAEGRKQKAERPAKKKRGRRKADAGGTAEGDHASDGARQKADEE